MTVEAFCQVVLRPQTSNKVQSRLRIDSTSNNVNRGLMVANDARRQLVAIVGAVTAFMLPTAGHAASAVQTIVVEPGRNTDVYFEINLSGKVYLVISAPAG